MTYSIVARDPQSGALGVGVQTHQPSVGAIVPWVKAGVGGVATQSYANPNFGPQGLALLQTGLDPEHTLAALLAGDTDPEVRQVAIVDAAGHVAVHTGSACIPFAGHRTGEGYSVQSNMMLNDTVPGAMSQPSSRPPATSPHASSKPSMPPSARAATFAAASRPPSSSATAPPPTTSSGTSASTTTRSP